MFKLAKKGKGYMIKRDWGLLAAWAIPSGMMLLLFIINGIFPFGDRSFLYSDMYHQYMPFFNEFLEKIKSGENLFYSFKIGVGSNFLALYVYYLASPVHWLALLVPKAYLMEFMSYLVIIKIGLCGFCFCLYLRKHFRTNSYLTVLVSVFYALSGYIAAYNWNIMWLDCVVLFPVIILGLEYLVKEGKPFLYCITLALSIFTNYYISIMICLFLVLYFVFLILQEERFVKPIIQFAIYSLLAGGLAAVLLLPEVCAILSTDFGVMQFPKEWKSYFSVLDELARHQILVNPERQLSHWPNIYCGVGVYILVPLFAVCNKISIKRRFSLLALAGLLLFSFSTNILDFIWHGMNYPDSLPARQSFIYIFLVLVMSFEALQNIREMEKKNILYGFLAAVLFVLFCEKFATDEDFGFGIEMITLLFLALYGISLYYYCNYHEKEWKKILGVVVLALVVVETGLNMYTTSVKTTSRSNYLNPLEDYQALYESVQQENSEFFRIEKFNRKTKNDGALGGYPTASLFSSTQNSAVADFYERLGMRHSKVYYCFDGATPFSSALLNVNYMFGDTEDTLLYEGCEGEDKLFTSLKEKGNITLYQCNYTLPFGYVFPTDFMMSDDKGKNPLKMQNDMVKKIGIPEPLFTKVNVQNKEEETVLTAAKEGYYYLINSTGTKKVKVEKQVGTLEYKDLKNFSLFPAGYLKKGEQVKIINGDDEDDTPKMKLTAYLMDIEVLKQVLESLSKQHMADVVWKSDSVKGNIRMKEPGKLVLSIPYEEGWQICVNGAEAEPQLFGDCFMALDLQPGEYTIDMKYVPKGLAEGIVISVCCVCILAGLGLWTMKHQKSKVEEGQEKMPVES